MTWDKSPKCLKLDTRRNFWVYCNPGFGGKESVFKKGMGWFWRKNRQRLSYIHTISKAMHWISETLVYLAGNGNNLATFWYKTAQISVTRILTFRWLKIRQHRKVMQIQNYLQRNILIYPERHEEIICPMIIIIGLTTSNIYLVHSQLVSFC